MKFKLLIMFVILTKFSIGAAATISGFGCEPSMPQVWTEYTYKQEANTLTIKTEYGAQSFQGVIAQPIQKYTVGYKNARHVMDTFSSSGLKGKRIVGGFTVTVRPMRIIEVFITSNNQSVVYDSQDHRSEGRGHILMSTDCSNK